MKTFTKAFSANTETMVRIANGLPCKAIMTSFDDGDIDYVLEWKRGGLLPSSLVDKITDKEDKAIQDALYQQMVNDYESAESDRACAIVEARRMERYRWDQ